jgi:hypothetical protein
MAGKPAGGGQTHRGRQVYVFRVAIFSKYGRYSTVLMFPGNPFPAGKKLKALCRAPEEGLLFRRT